MIQKNNSNTNKLKKALRLLNSKYKGNYNQKIHDEFKDFLVKNLDLIEKGMKLLSKELRVLGGTIDIVAKLNDIYFFIEVKTRESKHNSIGSKGAIIQLKNQKKGLLNTLKIFTKDKFDIQLIYVEYIRDERIMKIKRVMDSGALIPIKEKIIEKD